LSGNLTLENFLDIVKVHHEETKEGIRIVAYISDLKTEDLFDAFKRHPGFEITRLGDILQIMVKSIPDSIKIDTHYTKEFSYSYYYCHYNSERNLLLCFTSDTLEEAKSLDRFIDHQNRIFPLWIHPIKFDRFRRKVMEGNPSTIISEFHASRYVLPREEVIRSNYERRYFKYLGDDGKYTLDEISKAYGVLPTSIVFNVPNVCTFRITNMGKFAFVSGDLNYLFEIINEILNDILATKKQIDKARIDFIPVNMGNKEIRLPRLVPLDIIFSRQIEYSEIENLLDSLTIDEFNFEAYDMSLIPGSLHLSATVVDKNKRVSFSLTGNTDKVTLSPGKDTNFDTIMLFYKLVCENLDAGATINVEHNTDTIVS